jgi:hypothetical protein
MDVEQRVAKLERENRQFKAVLVALLALSGLTILMGQAHSVDATPAKLDVEEVRARSIELVNADGVRTAALAPNGDRDAALYLWDRTGLKVVLSAGGDGDGAGLSIYQRPVGRSVMLIEASQDSGGGAFLSLGNLGSKGGHLLIRGYEDGRRPFLQGYGESDKVIWTIP